MKNIFKNYGFIISMLLGIGAGCVFGWLWPEQAGNLSWLRITPPCPWASCATIPPMRCAV